MNTTLYIRTGILKMIAKIAHSHRKTCSEMIVLLIKEGIADISASSSIGKMVQYQDRNCSERGRPVHVRLREVDYEYFLDLRRLRKMSVSLILACAVKKFSSQAERLNSPDNYQWKSYILVKEVIGPIIVWKHIWGFPLTLASCVYYENSS